MATAQCFICQENYDKESCQYLQGCRCGHYFCQKCCTKTEQQNCPVCRKTFHSSTCDMPNNFTKLSFAQIGKDSESYLINSNDSEKNQPDNSSSNSICKQLFAIKQKKDNQMKNLIAPFKSNEHDKEAIKSNIQTIFSTNINLHTGDYNSNLAIKKDSNSVDLREDFPCKCICLILMFIFLVLLSSCGVLSYVKWNYCPGEEKLPLYLMVQCFCGIFMIFQFSVSLYKNVFSHFDTFILVSVLMIQLVWSVPGYVWMNGYDYNQTLNNNEQFCDYTLYTTAYWILNCSSIINGLIFMCLCVYIVIISKPSLGILDVVMITLISIFIAMVVIGFLNFNNCPHQIYLSPYVTVTGMTGLISSLFIFKIRYDKQTNLSFRKVDEDNQISNISKCNMIIYIIYCVFHFLWFTIGCILVFGSETPEFVYIDIDKKYCDHNLYMFLYFLLSIISLLLGTIIICTALFVIMFVFAVFCTFIYMV